MFLNIVINIRKASNHNRFHLILALAKASVTNSIKMRLPLQFSSRMMTTLRKTALTRTIEGYAGRSSIHGIGYVFDRDINIVDRLLWLFVVIAFIGGAAMLTWNFWSQWRDEQVGKSTPS